MARLKEHYEQTIKQSLVEQFGYKNIMEVPKLEKIVLNMGVGEASQDKKLIKGAIDDMTLISGQKPVVTKAKMSIATFKLRDGMTVGCKVTLRRDRMFEFLDRLVTIALPRVRDFRGLNGSTQVGATEINSLSFPSLETIIEIGKKAMSNVSLTEEIDSLANLAFDETVCDERIPANV